eukprot:g2214.t1
MLLILACAAAVPSPPYRLRVEHAHPQGPRSVVVVEAAQPPRLWWALPDSAGGSARGEAQAACQIMVHAVDAADAASPPLWDSGKLATNRTEGMRAGPTGGFPHDMALTARVRWWAASGASAPSAWSAINFTTAPAWSASGARWLDGSTPQSPMHGVQVRATFGLPPADAARVRRARLSVAALAYYKCWLDGQLVSDHELGHFTTFEQRVLFDTYDVTDLLVPSGTSASAAEVHAVGCALGSGWYGGQKTGRPATGTKALLLRLGVTFENGTAAEALVSGAGPASAAWSRADGPYEVAGMFEGIRYNATAETPGWTTAAYVEAEHAAAGWTPATPLAGIALASVGIVRAARTPPVRRTRTFAAAHFLPLPPSTPTSATTRPTASYRYDMGQNAAATITLRLTPGGNATASAMAAAAATTLTFQLHFTEEVQGGSLGVADMTYITTAAQFAQAGVDFTPSFTYGGFRYVVLTVVASGAAVPLPQPTADSVFSHFTHSDVQPAGGGVHFGGGSGGDVLNAVQAATRLTSLSNLIDVPTDCPTRERAGWTGDGGLTREVTSFNFDMGAFYSKWITDIADAQQTFRAQCMAISPAQCDCVGFNCTGEVPPAAPWYGHGYHGSPTLPGTDPAWGMALTTVTHHLLTWYADLDAAAALYPSIHLYLGYLSRIPGVNPPVPAAANGSQLLTYNVYSDWDKPAGPPGGAGVTATPPSPLVPPPAKGPRGVPSPLISSWAYITQLRMASEIAWALDEAADAAQFERRAQASSAAFVAAYWRVSNATGKPTFADGSLTQQAANALALDLALPGELGGATLPLDDGQRRASASALAAAMDEAQNHSIAGINGQAALFRALSGSGHAARAAAANVACDYPSFCNEIRSGNATTLWEKFDGTASHNHIMFGTQSAWYYRSLAGIGKAPMGRTFAGSGWRNIVLRPQVTCEFLAPSIDLRAVSAALEVGPGTVRSSWWLHACPSVPAPAPASPVQCSVVLEPDKYQTNTTGIMHLDCGSGSFVDSVLFADFGTPSGSCGGGAGRGPAANTFAINETCTTPGSKAVVEAACVGKQSCAIGVTVKKFGDRCLDVPKRLAAAVSCVSHATPPPAPLPVGPRAFDWNVSVPIGSTATVHVPLLGASASAVDITVDGTQGGTRQPVWSHGSFVTGSDGVLTARALGDAVVFSCVSGAYRFELRDAK